MTEKSSALNFISDYITMMHSSSRMSSPLLFSCFLLSLICVLWNYSSHGLIISHYYEPPPPSFSHLDSLLPPQSEYVFVHCTVPMRIYSMLVLVCCNTCLTLITLKNLVAEVLGFQSMKYGMKGIFVNISLFVNAVKLV